MTEDDQHHLTQAPGFPDTSHRQWSATMTCFAPETGELVVSGEGKYLGTAFQVVRDLLRYRPPGLITIVEIEELPQ